MKHTYPMTKPEWLRERNNDPCGTPNNHPFWNTVEVTNIGGGCKVFQKNFVWFVGYNKQTLMFWDGMILIDADSLEVA